MIWRSVFKRLNLYSTPQYVTLLINKFNSPIFSGQTFDFLFNIGSLMFENERITVVFLRVSGDPESPKMTVPLSRRAFTESQWERLVSGFGKYVYCFNRFRDNFTLHSCGCFTVSPYGISGGGSF
jgi:hypothetical protein